MNKKKLTNEQMDSQNWRYKKKVTPAEEHPELNGPVTVVTTSLPHVMKCSKCSYVAPNRKLLDLHWLDEH